MTRKGGNYRIDFLPDLNLTRTTIRDMIEEDRRLERALELSAELCLWYLNHHDVPPGYRIPLANLREMIINQGIEFEKLLDTRGYWLFKEEEEFAYEGDRHYLSGYDLVRIALGVYRPKWL